MGLDMDVTYTFVCVTIRSMRVALYARVSTDDGRQDTENQLHELRQFAASQGWEISNEYVDHASGKTDNRREFQLMFSHAAEHRFDVVLFWAIDRLSREGVVETLNHLRTLDKYGVAWRSFTEAYFDSCGPFKDVVVSLMATLARLEREKISERTKAGLRRAQRAGKRLGRPSYEITADVIRQEQAKGLTLARIAEESGVNLRTIMRRISNG